MVKAPGLAEHQKGFGDEISDLTRQRSREHKGITFKSAENRISQVGEV